MKRTLFIVVLLISILFSMTALATGPTYNWTGFYAGVQGSYATGSSDLDWPAYSSHTDHTIDGGMGGFRFGYNYQTPINIVVGIETDINGGKIEGSSTCPNPLDDCRTEVTWVGSTRARVGYAIWRFLPYVAFGVAYSGVDLFVDVKATGMEVENSYDTYFGWTPSAGVEFAITNNLIGSFEYAYYDFASKGVQTTGIYIEDIDNKIKFHTFKFGLSWKF